MNDEMLSIEIDKDTFCKMQNISRVTFTNWKRAKKINVIRKPHDKKDYALLNFSSFTFNTDILRRQAADIEQQLKVVTKETELIQKQLNVIKKYLEINQRKSNENS